MNMDLRVGEIIRGVHGRVHRSGVPPLRSAPLGALVRAGNDPPVYGVVCYTTTRGIDPGRRPIARGEHLPDEASVYQDNPQLEHLLKTEFNVVIIGHREQDVIRHYLPPLPPRIHAFVHRCSPQEGRDVTRDLGFLELLLNSRASSDEALAALVREAARYHDDPQAFLVRAGKELVVLLQGQGIRLNGLLRRLA